MRAFRVDVARGFRRHAFGAAAIAADEVGVEGVQQQPLRLQVIRGLRQQRVQRRQGLVELPGGDARRGEGPAGRGVSGAALTLGAEVGGVRESGRLAAHDPQARTTVAA